MPNQAIFQELESFLFDVERECLVTEKGPFCRRENFTYRLADKSSAPPDRKKIESSPFFVRRGGHCCRGDLVGRTSFWICFFSGQIFWLQIQRSRVRFPALPNFLSSSGSVTGSTQPREVNWGATWIKSSGSGPENTRLTAVGIHCADHVTPLYPQKLELTSPTSGGRSVGIVRSRTKATELEWLAKVRVWSL